MVCQIGTPDSEASAAQLLVRMFARSLAYTLVSGAQQVAHLLADVFTLNHLSALINGRCSIGSSSSSSSIIKPARPSVIVSTISCRLPVLAPPTRLLVHAGSRLLMAARHARPSNIKREHLPNYNISLCCNTDCTSAHLSYTLQLTWNTRTQIWEKSELYNQLICWLINWLMSCFAADFK